MLASAALLVAAAPALSAVKRDPRGDMRAPGLTKAERSAMDIVALETMYDGEGLLLVDVRFAGNLNGRLGRGHLRRALAGIVIEQRGRRRTAMVTAGSTRRPRAAERGPADALLVDRDAKQIRFIATDVKRPRRVIAATIPRPRSRGARAAQNELEFLKLFLGNFAFPIREGIEEERDEAERHRRFMEESCRAARALEEELDREEAELFQRAQQAEGARREAIQAVLDRLIFGGRRVDERVEACAGGQGGLPEDFKASWAHGTGKSRICVYVTGRDGQTGDVTINGTAEANPVKTFTLDASGRATLFYDITSTGPYSIGVRWTQADGTHKVRDATVTVTGGPPPPDSTPAGFAACPPPP